MTKHNGTQPLEHPEALSIKPDSALANLIHLTEVLSTEEVHLATLSKTDKTERRKHLDHIKETWKQVRDVSKDALNSGAFGHETWIDPEKVDVTPIRSDGDYCPRCHGFDLVTIISGHTYCKDCDEELLMAPEMPNHIESPYIAGECPMCNSSSLITTHSGLIFCPACDEEMVQLRQIL